MSVYSAGILMYLKKNDILYFLLGKDCRYDNWSDFGGKSDDKDHRNPAKTAAREFYEETCGVIMDMNDTVESISRRDCIECMSYKQNKYFMFLMKYLDTVHDNKFENEFKNQYELICTKPVEIFRPFREKSDLKWFSLTEILDNRYRMRSVFYNSFTENIELIKTMCA